MQVNMPLKPRTQRSEDPISHKRLGKHLHVAFSVKVADKTIINRNKVFRRIQRMKTSKGKNRFVFAAINEVVEVKQHILQLRR